MTILDDLSRDKYFRKRDDLSQYDLSRDKSSQDDLSFDDLSYNPCGPFEILRGSEIKSGK